jgi:hypothetical protein
MVVREKTHAAVPLTLDQALSNMELVGHDFYLFKDAVTGLPSVVYRRCGYDYGVIRLETADVPAADVPAEDTVPDAAPAPQSATSMSHSVTPISRSVASRPVAEWDTHAAQLAGVGVAGSR